MKSILTKAGKFDVEQIPCHHYGQLVTNLAHPTGVLHTTEGWWNSAIAEFRHKFAPHFLIGLKDTAKITYSIAQLIPVGFIGAACRAHNDQALVQVEMVGFSQEKPWLPDNGTLDCLGSLMLACNQEWGIPLTHPWKDGDFGLAGLAPRNTHRAAGLIGKVPGWYGHGDMPNPDEHWDPGNLEWSKVFDHAHELSGS